MYVCVCVCVCVCMCVCVCVCVCVCIMYIYVCTCIYIMTGSKRWSLMPPESVEAEEDTFEDSLKMETNYVIYLYHDIYVCNIYIL